MFNKSLISAKGISYNIIINNGPKTGTIFAAVICAEFLYDYISSTYHKNHDKNKNIKENIESSHSSQVNLKNIKTPEIFKNINQEKNEEE